MRMLLIMTMISHTAFAGKQELLIPSKHRSCKSNHDCTIVSTGCCAGEALNKKYKKKYIVDFDFSQCATVKCAEMKAKCQNNFCTQSHELEDTF